MRVHGINCQGSIAYFEGFVKCLFGVVLFVSGMGLWAGIRRMGHMGIMGGELGNG